MKRILVPLDGSALSEQAVPAAAYLADAFNSSLELIHVIDHPLPEQVSERSLDPLPELVPERPLDLSTDDVRARLREVANRYGLTCPVSYNVLVGDPVRRLLQASELDPDALIVMATHGRGGVVRAVLGSVADKVVRGASGPVMLVRPASDAPTTSTPLTAVLVGLDGSRFAERTLPRAVEVARATGATLHLVRVIESLWSASFPAGPYEGVPDPHLIQELAERQAADARAYLEGLASGVREQGVNVTWDVAIGRPVDEIVFAAGEVSAGLIFVATHGRGGLSRVFQGSVATGLATRCTVPLMVIPATMPGHADTVRYEPELTIQL